MRNARLNLRFFIGGFATAMRGKWGFSPQTKMGSALIFGLGTLVKWNTKDPDTVIDFFINFLES